MKKERKKRLQRLHDRAEKRQRERLLPEIEGVLSAAAGGYGFIKIAGSDPAVEYFVPPSMMNGAIDGDTVRAAVLPPRPGHPEDEERGPVARILEITLRKRRSLVGELLPGGKLKPLDHRISADIEIRGKRNGAEIGDLVEVQLAPDSSECSGHISRVFGEAGVIQSDLDAITAEFSLPDPYEPDFNEQTGSIVPQEIHRTDYRQLAVLTIDPFDAKDFDDALSLEPGTEPGQAVLGVHIADVAAYVPHDSAVDKQAALRGFSCYLPGRTLPMLPPALTARISMQAGQDSLAHTVFLTVDTATGQVLSTKREHTVIRVVKRLNYGEVQQFIDTGKAGENWDELVRDKISSLVDIVRKMRAYRLQQEQFIELPLPEIRVLCDEGQNKLNGLDVRSSGEAENIVEECMLAANQAVGNELKAGSIPGIFRIHPAPEPEKTLEFHDFAANFGLECGDIAERRGCRKFVASLPDDEFKLVILAQLLRAFARASYSEEAQIHFALGKLNYCHFTSPIRRYTDLTVHQQLWNTDLKRRLRSDKAMAAVAMDCNEKEIRYDGAYFAANDRLKQRLIAEALDKDPAGTCDAVVVRVSGFGAQVYLPAYGLYGFVEAFRLKHGEEVRPGKGLKLRLDAVSFSRDSR